MPRRAPTKPHCVRRAVRAPPSLFAAAPYDAIYVHARWSLCSESASVKLRIPQKEIGGGRKREEEGRWERKREGMEEESGQTEVEV